MIEQAMYFALGFLVAGLFTLMFLPAFWRRAMRLSMRRLQMLAPMSMEQVVAERDLIRAEAALNYRRLEQKMKTVKASKALDLLDVGRQAARVADLDARLAEAQAQQADLERRLAETQKIVEERSDLLSSTEAALLEMTARAERGVLRLRNLRSSNEELGRQTEVQQSRVTAHETKIVALHQQTLDLQRELDQLREKFAQVSSEAQRLGGADLRLQEVTAALASAQQDKDQLREKLAQVSSEARRLGGVDLRLQEVTAALASAQQNKIALQTQLDGANALYEALDKQRQDEVKGLEAALSAERQEEKDRADRLEVARSDNSMLQGAVEALRREHTNMRQNSHIAANADGVALIEGDISALRHAIADLGARMTHMSSPEEQKAPESTHA